MGKIVKNEALKELEHYIERAKQKRKWIHINDVHANGFDIERLKREVSRTNYISIKEEDRFIKIYD